MKRFLKPKLILSLVTVVMLMSAIAVPLASSLGRSHAAGSNPEPHHALHKSTLTVQFTPATNDPTFKATTDAPCSNATTVVPALLKDDKVHNEAEVVPTKY